MLEYILIKLFLFFMDIFILFQDFLLSKTFNYIFLFFCANYLFSEELWHCFDLSLGFIIVLMGVIRRIYWFITDYGGAILWLFRYTHYGYAFLMLLFIMFNFFLFAYIAWLINPLSLYVSSMLFFPLYFIFALW